MQFSVHIFISVLVFFVRNGVAKAKSTTRATNISQDNIKEDWPDLAAQGIKL